MDEDEYKGMVMDILKQNQTNFVKSIVSDIESNNITKDLDLKLRTLGQMHPFHLIIPLYREYLGLTITDDEDCKNILTKLKPFDDKNIIDKIIGFINGEDLDEDVVPEVDLLSLMEHVPTELYPDVYNCIDYIAEISDFE